MRARRNALAARIGRDDVASRAASCDAAYVQHLDDPAKRNDESDMPIKRTVSGFAAGFSRVHDIVQVEMRWTEVWQMQ